ncbi:ABC transporter substrate-binding protein [Pontibaca salina]|uniref:ABC transporter substrate-binding protein n=1 Tax=Pontibaca salina TaxID=2795731 RepID=A0A934HQY1_9RHOB|nr:ABC transporter substrate-binding protein [Pontibaca salina]MBI6630092.1 ABC transporter substrate-binding protein [Pontibaca salina]
MNYLVLLLSTAVLFLAAQPSLVNAFPLTVISCDREMTMVSPPERAIAHGSNLVEIMMALGLEDRMLGYTGRINIDETEGLYPGVTQLRQLQRDTPNLEMILDAESDFYFAGWSYGMRVGGEVTPDSLARYDVPVYELSESCIRLGQKNGASFDYLYRDLENLAAIFGVPNRAEALISDYRNRLEKVLAQVAQREHWPRIFVYDSGEKVPFTAGGFAMPQAIITAAGGENIAADIDNSWVRIDWETVAARDPEVVVIVDYGAITAAEKITYIKEHAALSHISAVRNDRFLVLSYSDLTPGPRNIDAVERLADFLIAG